ncbi:MAG: MFS transporter [Pseudomonadota bacterium]|nr:MFS transporter [Pseudomonadota bacterium]
MTGDRMQWRNLIAASAAVAVFSFTLGMMFPLLALIMESWGTSSSTIGLNAAIAPAGIMVAGMLIPRLARRFGSRNVALGAAFLTAATTLSYPLLPNLGAWFALRFLQGATVACLFALSEAWVVKFSEGPMRGRIVGAYATVISASFGLGPLVIKLFGIEGVLPFVAGAVVLLAAMLPISLVDDRTAEATDREEQHVSIFGFAPKAPLLLLAIFMHSVFDGAMLSLLPVYGVKNGYDERTAALLITAVALGNVFFQIPIGWIADRTSKAGTMAACFLSLTVLVLLLPAAIGSAAVWPLVTVVGAAGFGIYTVGLAMLGDRFRGTDLVAGTAAFSMVWGAGALVGTAGSGWAMDLFGPDGLPYFLAAAFAAFIGIVAVGRSSGAGLTEDRS